jgi:hypothetical protein
MTEPRIIGHLNATFGWHASRTIKTWRQLRRAREQ